MKKEIGILTWHYYRNFGSALQAYALQTSLKNLGFNVKLINYRNSKFEKAIPLKRKLCYFASKTIAKIPRFTKFKDNFLEFQIDYLKETKLYYDNKTSKIYEDYSTVISGSDQIWAPSVYNEVYFQEYVPDTVNKISYASSIGLDYIPDNLIDSYKTNLTKFSSIAVREEVGAKLLQTKIGIEASVVLDPTLLVNKDHWKSISKEVRNIKENYVFCYFLNKDNKYSDLVMKYAKKNNLKIYGISDKKDDYKWMTGVNNVGPREFLWLINNANTVFTDSYHGTIFSLLFHKKFWTLERFQQNDPICQNSRIFQLDNWFSIKNRIIKYNDVIEYDSNIDYDDFEKKLKKARELSLEYLKRGVK